jgi:hypothetical protein
MIALALLVFTLTAAGVGIYLGHVPHLVGHRLHAVVILALLAQLGLLLVPAAMLAYVS